MICILSSTNNIITDELTNKRSNQAQMAWSSWIADIVQSSDEMLLNLILQSLAFYKLSKTFTLIDNE